MGKIPLRISWLLALIAALFQSAISPALSVHAFAPLLALFSYRLPLPQALWASLLCGVIVDIVCSDTRFGIYALIFVVIEAFAFWQRRNFFEDKASAFIFFSTLLGACITLSLRSLLHLLGTPVPASPLTLASEFLGGAAADATYTLCWFVGPANLYCYLKKRGWKKQQQEEESE